MIINIKTKADEAAPDAAEMALQYLCISQFRGRHAADFSLCTDRHFFWQDPGRKYGVLALHALGRYLVLPDIYLAPEDLRRTS
jgi:hypothetical protein